MVIIMSRFTWVRLRPIYGSEMKNNTVPFLLFELFLSYQTTPPLLQKGKGKKKKSTYTHSHI